MILLNDLIWLTIAAGFLYVGPHMALTMKAVIKEGFKDE